jgi:hypothetical protein
MGGVKGILQFFKQILIFPYFGLNTNKKYTFGFTADDPLCNISGTNTGRNINLTSWIAFSYDKIRSPRWISNP